MQSTISSGADVISLKGSTTYAPGTVVAVMADAILTGRNRVMSVSTMLDGEYGASSLAIGVPVVLGKAGVERIIELDLLDKSQEKFTHSVESIKAALAALPS